MRDRGEEEGEGKLELTCCSTSRYCYEKAQGWGEGGNTKAARICTRCDKNAPDDKWPDSEYTVRETTWQLEVV